jgi:hypothetical protein
MTILIGIIFGFIYGFYISLTGIFKPQMLAMTVKKSEHYSFLSKIILTVFLVLSFVTFVAWCIYTHHSLFSYNIDQFFIYLGFGMLFHVLCYVPVMLFCIRQHTLFYWLEKGIGQKDIPEISEWLEEHIDDENMLKQAYLRFCDKTIFCQVWKSFSLKRTIEQNMPDIEDNEAQMSFIKI